MEILGLSIKRTSKVVKPQDIEAAIAYLEAELSNLRGEFQTMVTTLNRVERKVYRDAAKGVEAEVEEAVQPHPPIPRRLEAGMAVGYSQLPAIFKQD